MERVKVSEAAIILQTSQQFVRVAMQRGALPIGTAVQVSRKKWTYHISPKLLAEYSGADVAAELKKIRKGTQA